MRTFPAPGCGTSRSTISKSPPALGTCATFIGATATLVVAMLTSGWNLGYHTWMLPGSDRSPHISGSAERTRPLRPPLHEAAISPRRLCGAGECRLESRLVAAYKVQIGDKGRQCSRYNGGKLTRRCAVWGVSAADKSSAFDKIEKFN